MLTLGLLLLQQTIGKHQVWQTMWDFSWDYFFPRKSFRKEDLPKIDLSERVCERALCLPSTSSSLSWWPSVIKSLLALVFITKLPLHSVSCNPDGYQSIQLLERSKRKTTQYVMLLKAVAKLNKLNRCTQQFEVAFFSCLLKKSYIYPSLLILCSVDTTTLQKNLVNNWPKMLESHSVIKTMQKVSAYF